MPGKPKTAALTAYLREEVEGSARWELALELLAAGETLSAVAQTITVTYQGQPWTPSKWTLRTALLKHWPDEYRAALNASGESFGELALTSVQAAPETKEGIAKARELSSVYRWLASKRDPANYGDTPTTAIMVNNPGQLFLQAVARPGAVPPPKQKLLPESQEE